MRKWLVRAAIWCGVALLVIIEVGACRDIGGSIEHAVPIGDVQLNN